MTDLPQGLRASLEKSLLGAINNHLHSITGKADGITDTRVLDLQPLMVLVGNGSLVLGGYGAIVESAAEAADEAAEMARLQERFPAELAQIVAQDDEAVALDLAQKTERQKRKLDHELG